MDVRQQYNEWIKGKLVTRDTLAQFHKSVKQAGEKGLAARIAKALKSIKTNEPVRLNIDEKSFTKKVKKKAPKKAKKLAKKQLAKKVAIEKTIGQKVSGQKVSKPVPADPVQRTSVDPAPKTSKPTKGKALYGFTTADVQPAVMADTFTLPGEVGKLLGELQPYKLEIVIAGETHSSKSELGKQLADAFVSAGFKTGYIDWEQGGLESRDTQAGLERNVSPENRKKLMITDQVPRTLEAVKSLHKMLDVAIIDSGTKLNEVTNEWIDELRNEYPQTIWVILMQQNAKGGTRGGTAAEFDAPVVIKTYRPDESDYKKNYAYVMKNRGNATGLCYNMASKKIIRNPEIKVAPKKEVVKNTDKEA